MSPVDLARFVHPYYVASDERDLDKAFDEGKQRAIRTLERRIEQVRSMCRTDYERELCPQQVSA